MAEKIFERRRQKRIKVQLPIRLGYSNNEALATTKNISLLGACLDANAQISPGTRVALSLDVPQYVDDESLIGGVMGEGAIVRCDAIGTETEPVNYEIGVFFSNFQPDGEKKLSRYLDYLTQKEEDEVRQWVEHYRARMELKKRQIAKKKRELARKKAARLAKKRKKLAKKTQKKQKR